MTKEKKRKKGTDKKQASQRHRAKKKGRTGVRLAIAIVECVAMVLLTGFLVGFMLRSPELPQVYTAEVPTVSDGGQLVLPESSVFTGGDGQPCVYRVEEEPGTLGRPRYTVWSVKVQTEPFDEGRVAVYGISQFDTLYVMYTEAALYNGMEVALAG